MHSHLLALPPELRLLLYEYALTDTDAITLRLRRPDQAGETPLLLTNKLIRHEARALYYKLNTSTFKLHLDESTLAARWLATVSALFGSSAFDKLQLDILDATWEDLPRTLPLLHLHRSGAIELKIGSTMTRSVNLYSDSMISPDATDNLYIIDTDNRDRKRLLAVLEGLTCLADGAKLQHWEEQDFDKEFWDLYEHRLRHSTKRKSVLQQRLVHAKTLRLWGA